jgi:hypothetical protein
VTDQRGDRPERSIDNPDDLSVDEVEARLGIPSTAPTKVRRSTIGGATEPVLHATTRRRLLWRDSATILIGVVVALLVVRFVLPSGPATADASPSPGPTGLVEIASSTLSATPSDMPAPTLGNVVPPSLHLDATPTPIPVITLPPATLRPGQTPGPTPKPTPKPTGVPTPSPAPTVASFDWSCDVPTRTAQFDASASTGGGSLTYSWNFGDGSTGTGVAPSHLYLSVMPVGGYTVSLSVTGTGGTTPTSRSVVC